MAPGAGRGPKKGTVNCCLPARLGTGADVPREISNDARRQRLPTKHFGPGSPFPTYRDGILKGTAFSNMAASAAAIYKVRFYL